MDILSEMNFMMISIFTWNKPKNSRTLHVVCCVSSRSLTA